MMWLRIALSLYVIGALGMFIFQLSIGPVTPALSALRGAVWPIYMISGWPQGYRVPPGDQED